MQTDTDSRLNFDYNLVESAASVLLDGINSITRHTINALESINKLLVVVVCNSWIEQAAIEHRLSTI